MADIQTNREPENPWLGKTRAALRHRSTKIIVGIIVLILLILFITPFFVNADTFRPLIESRLSSALGRKVTLGHLSLSLWSGSLSADQVSIADNPAFSASPFFQAKSLKIGVSTGALLFHHQLHVTSFTAVSPQVHLIQAKNGVWNYASLGGVGASAGNSSTSSLALTVGKVNIEDGSVSVSTVPATGKPFVYTNVDATIRNLSLTTPMPFTLSADLPGNGTLKLTGTAGPIAQGNAIHTPFQAALVVKHFDPVAAGAVSPASGISMLADIHAKIASNGQTVTAQGSVTADRLKLSPHGSPAPQPVHIDFSTSSNLGAQSGEIRDLAIHTGPLAAHITGTYQKQGADTALNLHLSAPSLPVDDLEALLPAVGVKLPTGSSLHGGTLTAKLDITGPVAAPTIAGPVEIDKTELAGFDLASKIQGLTSFGKSSGHSGTAIRTLRANVVSTPQVTQFSQIYGDVPAIGTATGSGTVTPSGALDFQLVAKLASTGAIGGLMNAIGGTAGKLLHSTTTTGVPLRITGTASDPSIRADVGAILKQQTGGLFGNKSSQKPNPAGILKGLFGHKPQQ